MFQLKLVGALITVKMEGDEADPWRSYSKRWKPF